MDATPREAQLPALKACSLQYVSLTERPKRGLALRLPASHSICSLPFHLRKQNEAINLALGLQSITQDAWAEFTLRYAHQVTHLQVGHPTLPKYVGLLPRWTWTSGPICPHINSVHFLKKRISILTTFLLGRQVLP